MVKQLKQKALQNRVICAVVLVAVAAGALWLSGFAIFTLLMGPKPMDSIPLDQLEGQYVETDVIGLWDYYAYTEQTKNGVSQGVTEKEYIMPVGEQEFMGVAVGKNRIDEAEDLMERTNAVLNDESDEVGESMLVKGCVIAMDAQTRGFFHEVVGYDDLEQADQVRFLSMVLRDGYVKSDTSVGATWIFALIAAVLIGFGVFGVVKAAIGGYQSSIRKMCAVSGNAESTLEHIERFYEETQPIGFLRADENWVMLQNGPTTQLLAAQDIAWVHMSTVQHRVYFVPTGKTHSLAIWTRGGKKFEVAMPKKEEMEQAQTRLYACLPDAVFGYSDELSKLFQNDRASFVEIAKQQRVAPVAGAEEPELVQ